MNSLVLAPVKEICRRDKRQVKEGNIDNCLMDAVSVQVPRQFQAKQRSPVKLFEPMLDGFEIDFGSARMGANE